MKFKRFITSLLCMALTASCMGAVPLGVQAENSGEVLKDGEPNGLEGLTLPYTQDGYMVQGNITLPQSYDGKLLTWNSSNSAVIDTESHPFSEDEIAEYGANYSEIPAGTVTRQEEDTSVILTASTQSGAEKSFDLTVKAAPEKNYKQMSEDGDFKGYLYASFIQPAVSNLYQQTYFAASDDGLNWVDLNRNKPVLQSTMGTTGLRDHYIVRSPEGDKFYLLATDLDATSSKWADFAEKGSKYLMIWESNDLVNWSEERMVRVADDNTGCAWAPETIYDGLTGEYVVYWSGHDINPESENYGKKVVYYSKTRDFYSFTAQKQFVYPVETDGSVTDGLSTSRSFIDTTMIQGSDGLFYRTTKYEDNSPLHVFVDAAKYPLGEYKRVKTNLYNNEFLGVEGPGWFKLNKDDAEATGKKYCLMLDGYASPNKGVGFFPTLIQDLNNDWNTIDSSELEFERVRENFKMRSYAKHGGIVPLTQAEYDGVMAAYSVNEADKKDLSAYINDDNKVMDISDKYPSYPDNWIGGTSLDNDEYKYLGINQSKLTMGNGYGNGKSWVALQFDMASNSSCDNIIYDVDGKKIVGYCYVVGADGLWVGHGERSFGGSVKDSYGVKRLDNYLKTVVENGSDRDDTGHTSYWQHDIADIIIKNNNGTIDGYTGDYYTVETYVNNLLLSTEYYSGHANGISGIETTGAAYFGSMKMYSDPSGIEETPSPTPSQSTNPDTSSPEPGIDTSHMLYGVNFNNQNTAAYKGKTIASGNFTYTDNGKGGYAAVFNGTDSFLSLKNSDGSHLLDGKENIIVSMRVKTEKNTSNGWYFYTSWSDGAQVSKSRSYLGMLDNYKDIVGERYWNSSTCPLLSAPTKLGEWQNVTYVISKNKSEIYIDGKFVSEAKYTYSLKNLIENCENQVVYVGKANWGSGEYLKGAVDSVEIYDFAPEFNLENLESLKEDISLPQASLDKDGYSIEWTSSDESVISTTGKVTRPETGNKKVTLTAEIKFSAYTLTRTFEATVRGMDYCDYVLNISNEKKVDIQNNMFGLFFEDINYAADGGLYAEMVENRSFEQTSNASRNGKNLIKNPEYAWSSDNGTMKFTDSGETGLNANNTTYLNFSGNSFKNKAYDGMYVEAGKSYKISFYAKSDSYNGNISAAVSKNGTEAFSSVITDNVTSEWKKYEKEITAQDTVRNADFVISVNNGNVDFDMISVMPSDAVDGVFRKDLAEKLKALNPGFLRFPGGCVIEGYGIDDRYQWKNSVGSVEERKQNWSRWAADTGYRDYNQTLGLGFYEYFELCEYLDCDPVPVLSVGLSCEYQAKETVPVFKEDGVTYTDEFYAYIQDALDLIEFANGTDFEKNKWAALRKEMGHEQPFNLTMVGIGNEQWKIAGNQWYERYEAFEKEIHKVYPDIKLISTSGPSASGALFDDAWNWIRENQAQNSNFTYAVDEHYYMSPSWFLENDTRYDNYDRDTKVFAGEYAAHSALTSDAVMKNNLESAIAESAFLTGVERNADVVYMASYAPLFARKGYIQWAPDMIWFDDKDSYATPNYYVQSMYMNNMGTYTLGTTLTNNGNKVYQTVSYDEKTGDIIIKAANPYSYELKANIMLDDGFKLLGTANMTLLTGNELTDCNSIENPNNISPQNSVITASHNMSVDLPSNSFAVIRIKTEESTLEIKSAEINDGVLSFEISCDENLSGYDLYMAVYNKNGQLAGVRKNALSGNINVNNDEEYIIKALLWDKDKMVPAIESVVKTVN